MKKQTSSKKIIEFDKRLVYYVRQYFNAQYYLEIRRKRDKTSRALKQFKRTYSITHNFKLLVKIINVVMVDSAESEKEIEELLDLFLDQKIAIHTKKEQIAEQEGEVQKIMTRGLIGVLVSNDSDAEIAQKAEKLLKEGADPNVSYFSTQVIIRLAIDGYFLTLQKFLEVAVDLDIYDSSQKPIDTALMKAVEEYFFRSCIDSDTNSDTTINILKCIRLLLEAGAIPILTYNNLHYLEYFEPSDDTQLTIVNLFIEYGTKFPTIRTYKFCEEAERLISTFKATVQTPSDIVNEQNGLFFNKHFDKILRERIAKYYSTLKCEEKTFAQTDRKTLECCLQIKRSIAGGVEKQCLVPFFSGMATYININEHVIFPDRNITIVKLITKLCKRFRIDRTFQDISDYEKVPVIPLIFAIPGQWPKSDPMCKDQVISGEFIPVIKNIGYINKKVLVISFPMSSATENQLKVDLITVGINKSIKCTGRVFGKTKSCSVSGMANSLSRILHEGGFELFDQAQKNGYMVVVFDVFGFKRLQLYQLTPIVINGAIKIGEEQIVAERIVDVMQLQAKRLRKASAVKQREAYEDKGEVQEQVTPGL